MGKSSNNVILDDGDYYFNADGLMVFTRQYHLKRGYCCKSGCLNCPWDYAKKQKEAKDKIANTDAKL